VAHSHIKECQARIVDSYIASYLGLARGFILLLGCPFMDWVPNMRLAPSIMISALNLCCVVKRFNRSIDRRGPPTGGKCFNR